VSRRVKPDYPIAARRRREEGTVTLLITLDGGSVSRVEVERSSGSSMLDEAAAAAVRRWRFETARGSGRLRARVPVTFKLNQGRGP
jgi:protein TonB